MHYGLDKLYILGQKLDIEILQLNFLHRDETPHYISLNKVFYKDEKIFDLEMFEIDFFNFIDKELKKIMKQKIFIFLPITTLCFFIIGCSSTFKEPKYSKIFVKFYIDSNGNLINSKNIFLKTNNKI